MNLSMGSKKVDYHKNVLSLINPQILANLCETWWNMICLSIIILDFFTLFKGQSTFGLPYFTSDHL